MEELDAAVEGRLASEGQHDALRTLAGYHLLDEERGDRQEIDVVGDALGGLHRGDVGVDENGLDALFAESLQGLAARIVELARLAYLEGARAEHQYFLYVAVF